MLSAGITGRILPLLDQRQKEPQGEEQRIRKFSP